MIREVKRTVQSGYLMLIVLAVAQLGLGYMLFLSLKAQSFGAVTGYVLASIVVLICWAGLFMVHPNEAKVLQLFGKYVGTCHDAGLRWANPFYAKKSVSVRVRNFESGKLKVNDSNGSPIEIAAVVVWKVFDTAEALFEVEVPPIRMSRTRTTTAASRCEVIPSRCLTRCVKRFRIDCRRRALPLSKHVSRILRTRPK
jgi:hypothetical protein